MTGTITTPILELIDLLEYELAFPNGVIEIQPIDDGKRRKYIERRLQIARGLFNDLGLLFEEISPADQLSI